MKIFKYEEFLTEKKGLNILLNDATIDELVQNCVNGSNPSIKIKSEAYSDFYVGVAMNSRNEFLTKVYNTDNIKIALLSIVSSNLKTADINSIAKELEMSYSFVRYWVYPGKQKPSQKELSSLFGRGISSSSTNDDITLAVSTPIEKTR